MQKNRKREWGRKEGITWTAAHRDCKVMNCCTQRLFDYSTRLRMFFCYWLIFLLPKYSNVNLISKKRRVVLLQYATVKPAMPQPWVWLNFPYPPHDIASQKMVLRTVVRKRELFDNGEKSQKTALHIIFNSMAFFLWRHKFPWASLVYSLLGKDLFFMHIQPYFSLSS